MRAACSELRESEPFSKMLQAVLELGNYLNAGTQRGSAAGFKLDTLLKLADVKGVDRKTSLLQFVIQQLQDEEPRILNLKEHMQHVRPAATMQLSAVSAMVGEIRMGLRKVGKEAETAREAVANAEKDKDALLEGLSPEEMKEWTAAQEAAKRFADTMTAFHSTAAIEFEALEEAERATMADLRTTSEYFGEEFLPADPVCVVRTVRDFILLLEKAVADLVARAEKEAEAARKAQQEMQRAKKANEIKKRRQPEGEARPSKEDVAKNMPKEAQPTAPAALQASNSKGNETVQRDSLKGDAGDIKNDADDLSHPNSPPTPQVPAQSAASPCRESPNAEGQGK